MSDKDSSIVPVKDSAALTATLKPEFEFEGKSGAQFEAFSISGSPLVETKIYKVLVVKNSTGQLGLGMVAASPAYNWLVEKQMHILSTLQKIAADIDAKAKIKPFYGTLFPTFIDEFDTGEENSRVGVVMGFHPETKTYKELVPLTVALKGKRVDLQTATWMLSKALKLIDFLSATGFAVNWIDESNYFIETATHGVFTLNFMDAVEEAGDKEEKDDIKALASLVWKAAGGTDKSSPPHDKEVMSAEGYEAFVANLKRLMTDPNSAGEEMEALLKLADTIWERVPDPKGYNADGKKRPFHDYVTYDL